LVSSMGSKSPDVTESVNWVLDEGTKTEVYQSITYDTGLVKKWPNFEKDVTSNPFFHPKHRRIVKLKGGKTFPPDSYRYRNNPLTVVYLPEGTTKTIFCLDAASTTQISYKKRSRKKR